MNMNSKSGCLTDRQLNLIMSIQLSSTLEPFQIEMIVSDEEKHTRHVKWRYGIDIFIHLFLFEPVLPGGFSFRILYIDLWLVVKEEEAGRNNGGLFIEPKFTHQPQCNSIAAHISFSCFSK